ncbi:MAG: secondary thiamine-phosphate synthase enzyme YjbQ [Desulfococcaceae bacterium]
MILTVETRQKTEMIDITERVRRRLSDAGAEAGFCMVFVPHTTAGVAINENADPSVRDDILKVLNQLVPWEADYRHMEGNSPAHVKATLTGASELVAVENGKLVLGRWQGLFFCEFDGPRTRKVHLRFFGESRDG